MRYIPVLVDHSYYDPKQKKKIDSWRKAGTIHEKDNGMKFLYFCHLPGITFYLIKAEEMPDDGAYLIMTKLVIRTRDGEEKPLWQRAGYTKPARGKNLFINMDYLPDVSYLAVGNDAESSESIGADMKVSDTMNEALSDDTQ